MATTCEDLWIDISKEQSFKYLLAKQYDHMSRKRRLIITDSNIPITYSEDRHEYIVLSLFKDGKNYSNKVCKFESDKYPYIIFTDDMLSVVGDVECELHIFDHEGIDANGKESAITTFTFMMTISKSLMNHDRLIASSEFDILNNLIFEALNIPELIKTFNLSQEQIDALIIKINNDIDTYKSDFFTLSSEARSLITDVQTFLTTANSSESSRISAENSRVLAENKREADSASAIRDTVSATTNATNATNDAIEATQSTLQAIDDARTSSFAANVARDQCLAAIEGLHYEIEDINGGEADTESDKYEDDCNGGGA